MRCLVQILQRARMQAAYYSEWSVGKQGQWKQPLLCPEEEEVCSVNIRTNSCTTSSQSLQAWVNITSVLWAVNLNPGCCWHAELSGDWPPLSLPFLPCLQWFPLGTSAQTTVVFFLCCSRLEMAIKVSSFGKWKSSLANSGSSTPVMTLHPPSPAQEWLYPSAFSVSYSSHHSRTQRLG